MFKDVIGKNQVEAGATVGQRVRGTDRCLVQVGILENALVKIDTIDTPCNAAEIHLLDDPGACAYVENY